MRGRKGPAVTAVQAENPKIDVTAEIFPWANRDRALATGMTGVQG